MTHPLLYQINPRVLLQEIGRQSGRPATLDDLPDRMFEELAAQGFEWVWLLGVWQTGRASRQVSRNKPEWRAGFRRDLPDLGEADITGSPFAIQAYSVREELGGEAALERMRKRLAKHRLRLMLDFVPNHVALDHPWVLEHPEYLIEGTEQHFASAPHNFISLETGKGPRILAHGRDPYFPGWPDTLQLNYRHAGCRAAMIEQLRSVARRCDGVRCDMAMLLLPDVFQRTWGALATRTDGSKPVDSQFWPEAITKARELKRDFVLMAEVYWDLEYTLQQQGFDFTYDKRLYDRLRTENARSVRDHLRADPNFQLRSTRFLENHDEPRAATTFPWPQHQASAIVSYFVPGLRFFQEGQFDGRKVHVSMHLGRRPEEKPDPAIQSFYRRLLPCLARQEIHDGQWRLWDTRPAWDGNPTFDQFLIFTWENANQRLLVAVNYGPSQGQCLVPIRFAGTRGRRIRLQDLMGSARFDRDSAEIGGKGLFLEMPPWAYSVFDVVDLP